MEIQEALTDTTRDLRDELKRTERITVQAPLILVDDPKQKKQAERLMERFFSSD